MKHMNLRNSILLLAALSFAGCNILDCDESSDYSKQEIFDSFTRSKNMVTNIYSYLPSDFCHTEGAMLDAATDDAIHVYKSSNIWRFVDGTWSANRTANDVWGTYYTAIRSANLYLKESEGQDFKDWEFSDDYQNMMKAFANYPYEVRFLRAFFYFELAKRYHNIPLVTEVLTTDEVNKLVPASFEEVIKFVVDECTAVAEVLPVNYTGFADKETGRITKGAALALKSRATLYAASPLFSADDKSKWKAAASAAYELIGASNELGYKLIGSFVNQFGSTANTRVENILVRPVGETGAFEQANFPMGVEGGKSSTCPTQNLVDAFEMSDGTPFDWNNPAHAANPYANRDPRLALTVAYNGMNWPKNTLEIWEGGANGLPILNATPTGYYLRKYVNNALNFASGSTTTKSHHFWVLFRYAEVLLNYAEAMVNAFDNPDYSDADYPLSAREALNQIRGRATVNMPALPAGLSKADFIARLKNERRVELAFEGHRFWDVRRWKALNETADIYGVKVVKNDTGYEYTKFLYEHRTITDKLYFYPISNVEKYKNPNLKQNPGW